MEGRSVTGEAKGLNRDEDDCEIKRLEGRSQWKRGKQRRSVEKSSKTNDEDSDGILIFNFPIQL